VTVLSKPDSDKSAKLFLPPISSTDQGGAVDLSVVNRLDVPVELVWIDRQGNPQVYETTPPGGTFQLNTFEGHVWLLRKIGDEPIGCFQATGSKMEFVLDQASAETVERRSDAPRQRRRGQRRTGRGGFRVPAGVARSPHGDYEAFVKDENLWLKVLKPETNGDAATEAERQAEFALTTNATSENSFQRSAQRARLMSMQYGLEDFAENIPEAQWSPDSKYVLAFQTTTVPERVVTYVESSPADQVQPKLGSYTYAKPGDAIPVSTPRLFSVESRSEVPVSNELFPNPFELRFDRWSADSSKAYLTYNERGHQNYRVLELELETGKVRAVVDEHSDTFIHYSTGGKRELHWLDDGTLLWASERSGWNHLYRYDVATGEVVNAVTGGDWNVKRIERLDRENGVLWFYAVGIALDQDPYHEHFCRVNLDGSGFRQLTDGDGMHEVSWSPNRKYFIDKFSRVDLPPVHELRRAEDGSLVCDLEKADASEFLSAGGRLPERFMAKGRDGQTDIWGVIHRPRDFDPEKKYPVLESIYAGPHDYHVPKSFRAGFGQQRMADNGFVVVQIDGMGTAWRSKAFHDVCFRNLRDAGFPDRIEWIKAAAEKYSQFDSSRVGIYGGSAGGQNAMAAVLWHGDFYKAAVADCGCHDNRMDKIWWNEQWMGEVGDGSHYVASSNMENAQLLQGKLMLVVGELDRNVDPATTTQVVGRLIKANKDFDFLLVVGAGHGACESPYGSRKRLEFFQRHLQEVATTQGGSTHRPSQQ
jgi:dipeptidyl aminopeptidase/acylaminoacyl peptidase